MSLSPNQLRKTFGKFATGVTIMSILDEDGEALGVTANSFTSVSLEPPLILWCLRCEASIHSVFMEKDLFSVNVLAEGNKYLSDRQASKDNQVLPAGSFRKTESGVPVLVESMTSLVCRIIRRDDGGDHTILLAAVENIEEGRGGKPLLYFESKYRVLGDI